ncbi:unknown [Clostridium sp. CAG:921]|nr:unknown [Clostridium sp. CAG:921]
MSKSKISRYISVFLFVILMSIFEIYSIKCMFNVGDMTVDNRNSGITFKIYYVVTGALLCFIYAIIKEKLNRKNVKRSTSLIIRCVYLCVGIILTLSYSLFKAKFEIFSSVTFYYYIVVNVLNCFIIKKIIFNISKTDILSVFMMFIYSTLPLCVKNWNEAMYITFLTFFMTLFVFFVQIFIDELKQPGIKSKKYLFEAILIGIVVGALCLLKISFNLFIFVLGSLLFITDNLDTTNISFPKSFMAKLKKEKREKMYSIERIRISKLCLGIFVIFLVAVITSYFGKQLYFSLFKNFKVEISSSFDYQVGNNYTIKYTFRNFLKYVEKLTNISKNFYFVVVLYILFTEILAFLLGRKYDTKSTTLKLLTVGLIVTAFLNNLEILATYKMVTTLLLIIVITNTTNIYFNREERIKLLVA